MEAIKTVLGRLRKWAGKKVIMALVGLGMTALKTAHPDWPLPSEEFTVDLTLALLTAHTVTDVVHILKTAGKEVLTGKAGDKP